MAKFKITGIGRLFIFLLFFAPIAYFGATFLTGENGLSKIKGMVGGDGGNKIETSVNREADRDADQDVDLESRNEAIIKELRNENARLKRKVRNLEAELAQ